MRYDVVIIGGGHNGLVAAAYLAQAGQKVAVFEKRPVLGGAAATEELWPGVHVDTGSADAGLFSPKICADLDLENHGLSWIDSDAMVHALSGPHAGLTLRKTGLEPSDGFPADDIARFEGFSGQLKRFGSLLGTTHLLQPPDPLNARIGDLLPWLRPALKLKKFGQQEMMNFLRVLPMPANLWLDEWFASATLKGLLAAVSVRGGALGPWSSGSALMLIHQASGTDPRGWASCRFVKGGVGRLSEALAAAARAKGAQIETGKDVQAIEVGDGAARGVTLEDGTSVSADVVLSGVDARTTFFKLIGAPAFEPKFVRRIRHIRYAGTTARVHYLLNRLPEFHTIRNEKDMAGYLVACDGPDALERAYDATKYGECSAKPALEITIPNIADPSRTPEGKWLLSATVRYAPYTLRGESWSGAKAKLEERVGKELNRLAPGFSRCVEASTMMTPLDFEREYGLTEGSIHQGQMALDQVAFMRPVAGWGGYRTPVENLFLCGAAAPPGGGLTGAPGHNAAQAVLGKKKT